MAPSRAPPKHQELDKSEAKGGGGFETEMPICPAEGFASVLARVQVHGF